MFLHCIRANVCWLWYPAARTAVRGWCLLKVSWAPWAATSSNSSMPQPTPWGSTSGFSMPLSLTSVFATIVPVDWPFLYTSFISFFSLQSCAIVVVVVLRGHHTCVNICPSLQSDVRDWRVCVRIGQTQLASPYSAPTATLASFGKQM